MTSPGERRGSAVRPGSRTRVSVPLVLPQNRYPERSASQTYRLTEDLRRGVEGPRGCLINPCSAGLSGHQNYEKIEKDTTSDRGSAVKGSALSLPFPTQTPKKYALETGWSTHQVVRRKVSQSSLGGPNEHSVFASLFLCIEPIGSDIHRIGKLDHTNECRCNTHPYLG